MAATAEGKTSTRPHCREVPSAVGVFEAMRGKWYNSFPDCDSSWSNRLLPIGRYFMARRCAICGKEPQYGHHVSHAKNRVNRRFLPNLQMGRVTVAGRT